MRNGRFNTSKLCRGKASKSGGAVHPFSQKAWPIPQTSKFLFFLNQKNYKKKGHSLMGEGPPPRPGALNPPFAKKISSSYLAFFAHVVNSCWLAPAHARPAQISSKNFKHP
jgi:hypothetical protein